ncbi:hypothetical protein GQ44DRAFT_774496 [Phaeosphaeriaceae sp. PMI808]|nr:hypothetical protein GQ44DRAFT_774496 [Phaeosphaeriaceae sp. PMI808]
MAQIHRVEVLSPRSWPILVSDAQEELPEDRDWKNTRKASPGNSILYRQEENAQGEKPFAFLGQGNEWLLEVEVHSVDARLHGKSGQCIMYETDTFQHKSTRIKNERWSQSTTLKDATVFTFLFPGTTPFGFFGSYGFLIEFAEVLNHGETKIQHWVEDIYLEAYYLSVRELPKYFEKGIPLCFLRMFVLPQAYDMKKNEGDIKAWVANVTNIAFGSKQPFNGSPSDTKDHWLVYNASGFGSPSFTGMYGESGLNLNAWLDAYRNWDQSKASTRVNCYDQAAVTEVALCLGVPYQQIHWEYHQRYGYIRERLVGWEGTVNSPYFDNVKSKPFYTDENDSARQPFRNHAYLSWSLDALSQGTYESFHEDFNDSMEAVKDWEDYSDRAQKFEKEHNVTLYMIDACGGPCVGDKTREVYEGTIGHILDPTDTHCQSMKDAYEKNPGTFQSHWKEVHHLGSGVTNWGTTIPVGDGADYKAAVGSIMKLIASEADDSTLLELSTDDINKLKTVFQKYIGDISSQHKWKENKQVVIRSFETKEGVQVHETKTTFAEEHETRMDRAASMRIAIHKTSGGIQKALSEHLAFKVLTSSQHFIRERGHASILDKTVPIAGSYYTRALQWHNVAIEITIEGEEAYNGDKTAIFQTVLNSLGA